VKCYSQVILTKTLRANNFKGGVLECGPCGCDAIALKEVVVVKKVVEETQEISCYIENTNEKITIAFERGDLYELCKQLVGKRIKIKYEKYLDIKDFYNKVYNELKISNEKKYSPIIGTPVEIIAELLDDRYDYSISNVHGDLHLDNLMYSKTKIAIIDYGLTKNKFITIHDIVTFVSNLIVTVISKRYKYTDIECMLKCAFGQEKVEDSDRVRIAYIDLIKIFRYDCGDSGVKFIREICSAKTYYACLVLYLMSMLKFELEDEQKIIAVKLAAFFYAEYKKNKEQKS